LLSLRTHIRYYYYHYYATSKIDSVGNVGFNNYYILSYLVGVLTYLVMK